MTKVDPIPVGSNSLNISIVVPDGKAAIAFYEKAFGAESEVCLTGPGGEGVLHAGLRIGNSTLMLGEENEQWGQKSAATLGGSPASVHLYVEDVDAAYKQAVDAGCKSLSEPADQFWGDRMARVEDPFGFTWGIATQIEIVPADEMRRRAEEWMKQMMG